MQGRATFAAGDIYRRSCLTPAALSVAILRVKDTYRAREFSRHFNGPFDELGIEIPNPRRTLDWGNEKERDGLVRTKAQTTVNSQNES